MRALFSALRGAPQDPPAAAATAVQPFHAPGVAALGRWLLARDYRFTAVTPATHARVAAQSRDAQHVTLRDVFGWNKPFSRHALEPELLEAMRQAGVVRGDGGMLRSTVCFASLHDKLLAHVPCTAGLCVPGTLGPDAYRFVQLLESELARVPLRSGARILDLGCGAGHGGVAAKLASRAAGPELLLADPDAHALAHAQANAALAGLTRVGFVQGHGFEGVQGQFDLVVAQVPYLVADGAGGLQPVDAEAARRTVALALPRLAPGGRLVLYTGVAITQGRDPLAAALQASFGPEGAPWRYHALDPDVHGELLHGEAGAHVERIAAVGLTVRAPER